MALFDLHTTEPQEAERNQPHAVRFKGKNKFALGKHRVKLEDLIGKIEKGESIHIPSMGNWSLSEMIEYVINQIGPSVVHLTSWAISEKSVLKLLELRDKGQISSLNCLFSSRTPSQCPSAWQLSDANIESLKTTQLHAKVVAMKSASHSISIVTSANLTNNPRVERYTIIEDEGIYEMDKSWIEELIMNGDPFKYESK